MFSVKKFGLFLCEGKWPLKRENVHSFHARAPMCGRGRVLEKMECGQRRRWQWMVVEWRHFLVVARVCGGWLQAHFYDLGTKSQMDICYTGLPGRIYFVQFRRLHQLLPANANDTQELSGNYLPIARKSVTQKNCFRII